jgi:divalent metal cation (Fe/Co/Zn/Cd) transporter
MSVLDSHKLSHKIADKIREEINDHTEVIIHIEPYLGGDKIV